MAPKKKTPKATAPPPQETRPIDKRGEEWQAEKLTGAPAGDADAKDKPHTDELVAYLALPQVNNENEWTPLKWWEQHAKQFPNLSVMARQYLGCPATSATVERLFSKVGIAFSSKRKSAGADTIANIIFTGENVA